MEVGFDPHGACFPDAHVTLRTNGLQGGDGGHGGFVEITFKNFDANGLAFQVEHNGRKFGDLEKLVLRFEGDWEYHVALNIFETLAVALREILAIKSEPGEYHEFEEKLSVLSQLQKVVQKEFDYTKVPEDDTPFG
jgi:hypothetical protein